MRTAVVVGAGVGGLAAAGGLARSGWHVTLLERDDRLRGSGVALLIWRNGAAALHALGVSLGDIAFPVPAGGIRRPDGRWLVEAHEPGGAASRGAALGATGSTGEAPEGGEPGAGAGEGGTPGTDQGVPTPASVVVHADDLHDALMAGLGENIEIRTAMNVTGVRAAGERPAVTTGKHTFEADLVVAADGSRSVIRRRLATQSALAASGYTAWRAVIPWFRAPKLPETAPAAGEMLGVGQRFLHATLGERGTSGGSSRGGIYWAATAPGAPRPESPQTQLTLLRRWFADWQAPVAELLAATEPEDIVQQAGEDLRPLPRHFGFPVGAGGIVLLGDAAHAATPNLAQGACLAFEDAATLCSVVAGATPGETLTVALDAYTRARRARVARVARDSRRLGRVLQVRGRLAIRARDVALERLSLRIVDRAAAAALQWTPPPPADPSLTPLI